MKKGTLIAKKNGCTLSVIVGDYNKAAGKYEKIWVMVSPKTGSHSINTFTNQPDARVWAHWNGFLAAQNEG